MRDENLHIEIDEDLFIDLQCKGTKLQFTSRVSTRIELHNCRRFELKSEKEWNPETVDLNMMHRISSIGAKAPPRQIFKMQSDTKLVSPSPTCHTRKPVWKYDDPSSDESILNEINPCLVSLKELTVATQSHNKEIYPARRTFVNTDRHK
jgi:hypothetical protein